MNDPPILEQLARVASDLGPAIQPPELNDLLHSITRATHDLTGAAACSIAMLDRETEELWFVAATGPGAEAVLGVRMGAHEGIAGWALASGQAISVGEVSQDPRFARDVAEATGYIPETIFAIPLETQSGAVGVLEILDADPGRPAISGVSDDQTVSTVVAILAKQAAIAISTSMIFSDLGRVLFSAATRAAKGQGASTDLQDALARTAAAAQGPSKELAQLLTVFNELGNLGTEERQAAAKLLFDFLVYARSAQA